jgi:hypothetical protein
MPPLLAPMLRRSTAAGAETEWGAGAPLNQYAVSVTIVFDAASPAEAATKVRELDKLMREPTVDITLQANGIKARGVRVGTAIPYR